MMAYLRSVLFIFFLLAITGCISGPFEIPTTPLTPNEKILGQAAGSGGGAMFLGFIPLGQNTRFENAYNQALQTQPGATRLINLRIKEQWFWAYILEIFNFQVEGTAVGPK